jgi:hypothetical protein
MKLVCPGCNNHLIRTFININLNSIWQIIQGVSYSDKKFYFLCLKFYCFFSTSTTFFDTQKTHGMTHKIPFGTTAFLLHNEFNRCVKKHEGNYKVKILTCWHQFLYMMFGNRIHKPSGDILSIAVLLCFLQSIDNIVFNGSNDDKT